MSRQVNKKQMNKSKQIRIDSGWHKILKIAAAELGIDMGDIIESCLADNYEDTLRDLKRYKQEAVNVK